MTVSGALQMARLTKGWNQWRQKGRASQEDTLTALGAHAGLMISSAVHILGSLHDAEDIAQDIAERLLRSPPLNIRNWPAYLRTLAVNGAIDRLRKRRPTEGTDDIADIATPEASLENDERAEALREAIAGLPQRDATLFSLYYLADVGQAEIGRQLDMTENAVAVALHRIRKKLGDDLRQRLQLSAKEQ
ncbi:MAG: RNA polymerase sigma factor [Woeseiaceae bacterium]